MSRDMPDTKESQAVHAETELEHVVLNEMRRLGRAVDALADRMEVKLDQLARDLKAADEKIEARVRSLEIEAAKAGVRIGIWGAAAGIASAGVAEVIAQALFHH